MSGNAPKRGFARASRPALGWGLALALVVGLAAVPGAPSRAGDAAWAGDVGNGRKVFARCKPCHSVKPEKTGTFGPNLYGVFDRVAGREAGYPYSASLAAADFVWTPERLEVFLADPRGVYPDTKMTFPGLPDATERADVIAYLLVAARR